MFHLNENTKMPLSVILPDCGSRDISRHMPFGLVRRSGILITFGVGKAGDNFNRQVLNCMGALNLY